MTSRHRSAKKYQRRLSVESCNSDSMASRQDSFKKEFINCQCSSSANILLCMLCIFITTIHSDINYNEVA